jgi:hypothetical protein
LFTLILNNNIAIIYFFAKKETKIVTYYFL